MSNWLQRLPGVPRRRRRAAAASEATTPSSARVAEEPTGQLRLTEHGVGARAGRCRTAPRRPAGGPASWPVGPGRRGRHEGGQDLRRRPRSPARAMPAASQYPAASAGAEAATARAASTASEPADSGRGRRPGPADPRAVSTGQLRAGPARAQPPRSRGAAASSRPAAAIAIAMPGQALTGGAALRRRDPHPAHHQGHHQPGQRDGPAGVHQGQRACGPAARRTRAARARR